MKKLLVICGPTGSGKSELALSLAERFGGEIVGADSMQIYKYMDIGTAKPTREDRERVPHHMVDFLEPGENYSVSRYVADAEKAIEDIFSRGRLPIVCGGTGLYIRSLLRGSGFCSYDPAIRERLEEEWEKYPEKLYERMKKADPAAALKISANDRKRVIRALEVCETGEIISGKDRWAEAPLKYSGLILGLLPDPREYLYERIDLRVDKMMEKGLLGETERLYNAGLLRGTAAQAIGYKEMLACLGGEQTLSEATELLKRKSRNYAKRQITWFKKETGIRWLTYGKNDGFDDILHRSTELCTSGGLE